MGDAAGARRDDGEGVERREVRAADPSLSPEANRVLTDELRAAVGRDAVELPAGRRHAEREPHGGRSGVVVRLAEHRLVVALGLLGALVIGAIVSLATGSWWFLALAFGLVVVGLLAVTAVVLAMTTETEHLSPSAAARLEDEGVSNPDRAFSELVEEYAPDADAKQRKSMTPSHDAGRPVGP